MKKVHCMGKPERILMRACQVAADVACSSDELQTALAEPPYVLLFEGSGITYARMQLRTSSGAAMYKYTAGWPSIGPLAGLLRAANGTKIA
jgi:hypothetical protein